MPAQRLRFWDRSLSLYFQNTSLRVAMPAQRLRFWDDYGTMEPRSNATTPMKSYMLIRLTHSTESIEEEI